MLLFFKYQFIVFFTVFLHDFHTSLAEMDYNESSASFEISVRVFTDDLAKALKNNSVQSEKASTHDSKIEAYCSSNFRASYQGKILPSKYLGSQVENDITWIYLEIPSTIKDPQIDLKYSILTELYDDQANILNYKYKNFKKTYLYGRSETEQLIGK